MRAVMVNEAGGPLTMADRSIPEPGPGEVRIRVRACGICHSDAFTVLGQWPGIVYPRAPGHEIAGTIDALGSGVSGWDPGARVGVGWHGGHDGTCASCRRGDFITCSAQRVPGIAYDGGYAEYVVAPTSVLAPIPDGLDFIEAAPLMCAGVTTFNALRNSGAVAGDIVAILGIGGLGHLGVQFAAKMGFHTIAIARGSEKASLAKELGAHAYIDSTTQDVAAELQAIGGAAVVLATATSASAMEPAIGGLAIDGTLLIVGAAHEPLPVNALALIGGRRRIAGWPSGTGNDSAETMRFAVQSGVRAKVETMPVERTREAYERMMSGAARFRMVVTYS